MSTSRCRLGRDAARRRSRPPERAPHGLCRRARPMRARRRRIPTPWLYGDQLRMVGIKIVRRRRARLARRVAASSPTPTSRTPAGCSSIRDAELLRLADTRPRTVSRSRRTRSAMRPMRRSSASTSSCRANTAATGAGGSSISRSSTPPTFRASRRPGIIASMQPTHQTSDRLMAEKRLGPNRLDGAYAWQTVLKSGREAGVRQRLPGGIAQPLPRPLGRSQPPGHQRSAAGRLDSSRSG